MSIINSPNIFSPIIKMCKISTSNCLNRRIIVIFSIFNYILLLLALLIILITPPATGYEYSIYGAYPIVFWYLLISSIFLGMVCSILSLQNAETKNLWMIGFLAELIAISILLFLPMIRGYFLYGSGDVATHIGYMLDIETNGSFGTNHYPGFHIIGTILRLLTGLTYGTITIGYVAFLSLISIFFWFILGKTILKDRIAVGVFVLIAALPMLTSGLFTPNSLANLLFPLLLFFSAKSIIKPNFGLSLCFVLFGGVLVFFHPLVSIMALLVLAMLLLYIVGHRYYVQKDIPSKKLITISAIIAIIFFSWSSYLISFVKVLQPLLDSITGSQEIESGFAEKLNLIGTVDVDFIYLAKLVMYSYGGVIIIGFLTIICISLIIYFTFKGKKFLSNSFFLYFSIIACVSFYALTLFIYLTINEFNISRIYRIALIFSFIVIAYTAPIAVNIYFQYHTKVKKFLFITFILLLSLTLIYFVTFGFHLSPIIKKPNQQVMESNSFTTQHYFEHRDSSIPVIDHGISLMRFNHAIYGKSNTPHRYTSLPSNQVPDHYGYTEGNNFGSYYDQDYYFFLTKEFVGFYPNMYPEFPDKWRYTDKDFQMLEFDSSVNKVYSNKFSYISYINSRYLSFSSR